MATLQVLISLSFVALGSAYTLYRTSAPVFAVQDLGYGWTQYRFCLPWYEESVTASDVRAMEFQVRFSECAIGASLRVNFDVVGPSALPWAIDVLKDETPYPDVFAFSMMQFIDGDISGWSLEDLDDNVVSGTIVSSFPIDRMGIALLSNATLGLVTTPPEGSCTDPCTTFYDQCGVCSGDSSSCMGCDEIPNAVVDNCGVCGGEDDCMETVPIPEDPEGHDQTTTDFPATISLPSETTAALDLYTFVMMSLGGFAFTILAALLIQRCARRRQRNQTAATRPRLVYMIPPSSQVVYQPLKYPSN
jgi:hypothetical protein